ncbi:isochorismatase family protein [Candidatus Woesearchaeota archaeon]|nr:isochorismatase family protein [Candidatus Woesearchaeota archaeon]
MERSGGGNYSGLAVLVIDMQIPYLKHLDPTVRLALVGNQWQVINYYNQRGVPILGVETKHHGRTIPILRRGLTGEAVQKSSRDGLLNTDLEERLDGFHSRDLIVMGIYRSECVAATIERAYQFGYKVSTANSVIADYPGIKRPLNDRQLQHFCSLYRDHRELCSPREGSEKD